MVAATELLGLFARQRSASRHSSPGYKERKDSLRTLERLLQTHQPDFIDAIAADFGGRAAEETLALELYPTLTEIRHATSRLRDWMEPRTADVPLVLRPGKAEVRYQPLGVIGILSPWNYPLLLSMSPVAGALAAGNRVLLKPSELAPVTSRLMAELVAKTFESELFAVVEGGADLASEFAALPFDHLLFTGSTRIGKLVMRAASENLTPVTLELGGKSPAIVHADYPMRKAAERILTGKLYNAGQTCVAPDYVLAPESHCEAFIQEGRETAARMYPRLVENAEYTRIINVHHYRRLRGLIEDALRKGGRAWEVNPAGESCNEINRVMPPVLLTGLPQDAAVMEEEIFGPLLPVIPYSTLDEAIEFVSSRPRPLALYYFDSNQKRIDQVLERTVSGGVTVNDCLMHLGVPDLPFGGVGASGMGQYHGFDGFAAFSKKKAVFLQSRWTGTTLFRPPYSQLARRVISLLVRGWSR